MRNIQTHQYKWLEQESAYWEQTGLINPQVRQDILRLYPEHDSRETQRQGAFILITLSFVLLGLAALWVIAQNWDIIPWQAKLGLPAIPLLICSLSGLFMDFQYPDSKNGQRIADLFYFFGVLLFGAQIWVTSQVFNDSSPLVYGMTLWSTAALAIALSRKTIIIHLLTVFLLMVTSVYSNHWLSYSDYFFINLPIIIWNVFLALIGIYYCHKNNKTATGKAYIFALVFGSIFVCNYWYNLCQQTIFISTLAFYVPICFAVIRNQNEDFAPHSMSSFSCNLGLFLMGFTLLFPSMDFWFFGGGIPINPNSYPFSMLIPGLIAEAVILIALFGTFWRIRLSDIKTLICRTIPAIWITLIFLTQIFFALNAYTSIDKGHQFYIQTMYIFILFIYSVYLIYYGLSSNSSFRFRLGLTYFFIWIMMRYDLFYFYGGKVIGTAGVFLFGAIILAVIAYLWLNQDRLRLIYFDGGNIQKKTAPELSESAPSISDEQVNAQLTSNKEESK